MRNRNTKQTIEEKCSQHLEVNIPKPRLPNVISFNVPEEFTPENAEEKIMSQNHETSLIEGSIRPTFTFRNKKNNNRNLVVEASPETRKLIIQRKLKIGWQLCNVQEYMKVNRCFKCSKFNHRAQECTGEVICPLCTGKHKLKECTAQENDFKCINCITHNL
jgi:hypothetical protein